MIIEGIDYTKCIHCEKCEKVCPSRLFLLQKRDSEAKSRVVFSNPYRLCVRCGHCIAICPTEAINYSEAEKSFELTETKEMKEYAPYEKILTLLRMRRSIRVYKDKQISKDEIEKVLEAMRYAPSASNLQGWRYIILTNKKEIQMLSEETAKFFLIARKLLPLRYLIAPFLGGATRKRVMESRTKVQLEKTIERVKQGEDVIFFHAPCVIILYSKTYTGTVTANDAGIALTYGMLAAQSLGLGTCWIGFAQRKLQQSRKLRKHFGIPRGFVVQGVLTLGTPAFQFERGPPRRKLRTSWFE